MAANRTDRPPIIFLHIGWAREYRGASDDPVQGKFGFIVEGNDEPGEALNFRDYDGRCFGYAAHWTTSPAKLGAGKDDDHVDGVLVVWTATSPEGDGRFIVGWYRNARVYSQMQVLRPDKGRPDILADASASDCHLVPVDDRSFFIPSMQTGWPGRPRAWYPYGHLSEHQLEELLAYIDGKSSNGFPLEDDDLPRMSEVGGLAQDPDARLRVEKAAEMVVADYYRERGWIIGFVGKDKLGWDLNVTRGKRWLRVEVKGPSGHGPVELTPREYNSMRTPKLRMSYRIAIVFEATTTSPTLTIFRYSPGDDAWVSEAGDLLRLQEKPGAVATF